MWQLNEQVCVFVWLRWLFPGNESNGCEILCPAVNNAVCKKCEQGNLEKTIVAGGWRVVAEWNGLCFALRLQRVCRNMFYHVCLFFWGRWGAVPISLPRGYHDDPWRLTFPFWLWFISSMMLKGTLVETLKNLGVAQANESKSNHSKLFFLRKGPLWVFTFRLLFGQAFAQRKFTRDSLAAKKQMISWNMSKWTKAHTSYHRLLVKS